MSLAYGSSGAEIELRRCDLASLGSVRGCAASLCEELPALDVLVNNAGVLTAYREPSPAAAAKSAAADGFRVVAVELAGGALPLFEAPLGGDVCLAIGNEDHGCSPALLSAVHAVSYIPQVGRVGSLNVAVAAAIALAEVRRREWTAPER